jgi:hypothetical protein
MSRRRCTFDHEIGNWPSKKCSPNPSIDINLVRLTNVGIQHACAADILSHKERYALMRLDTVRYQA